MDDLDQNEVEQEVDETTELPDADEGDIATGDAAPEMTVTSDSIMEITDANAGLVSRKLDEDEDVADLAASLEDKGFDVKLAANLADLPEHWVPAMFISGVSVDNGKTKVPMLYRQATIMGVPTAKAVPDDLKELFLDTVLYRGGLSKANRLNAKGETSLFLNVEDFLTGIPTPEAECASVVAFFVKKLFQKMNVKANVKKADLINAIKSKSFTEEAFPKTTAANLEVAFTKIEPVLDRVIDAFNRTQQAAGKATVGTDGAWLLEAIANRESVHIEPDQTVIAEDAIDSFVDGF